MVYRTLSAEVFADVAGRILYEDNHLLIFNKRVGEIVQGDKTGDEPLSETLKAFIAQRDEKPGQVFMGVPHRLDRPVSGIAVFAKTSKCLERLNAMFREGEVHKTYWALTCARPDPAEGELQHWLYRNEKQNKSYAYDRERNGSKLARLRYRVLRDTDRYHLVEVELLTGGGHRLSHQGRPEIRRPALQSRRRHLSPRPPHHLPPSRPQRICHGRGPRGLAAIAAEIMNAIA